MKKKKNVWDCKNDDSLFKEPFEDWEYVWGKEWNEKITPLYKRVLNTRNDRSMVLIAMLVLEYQIDIFLDEFIPNKKHLVDEYTPISKKLAIIRAFNLLPDRFIHFATILTNIRNEFAHNVNIDSFKSEKKSVTFSKKIKSLMDEIQKYDKIIIHNDVNTIRQRFYEMWRVVLQAFHNYCKNMKLYIIETRKKEYVDKLYQLSEDLKKEREVKSHKLPFE